MRKIKFISLAVIVLIALGCNKDNKKEVFMLAGAWERTVIPTVEAMSATDTTFGKYITKLEILPESLGDYSKKASGGHGRHGFGSMNIYHSYYKGKTFLYKDTVPLEVSHWTWWYNYEGNGTPLLGEIIPKIELYNFQFNVYSCDGKTLEISWVDVTPNAYIHRPTMTLEKTSLEKSTLSNYK